MSTKINWKDNTNTTRNGSLIITRDDKGIVTAHSYETCIAARRDDGVYAFNASKYSSTTSRHQNKVRAMIIEAGIVPVVVDETADLDVAAKELIRLSYGDEQRERLALDPGTVKWVLMDALAEYVSNRVGGHGIDRCGEASARAYVEKRYADQDEKWREQKIKKVVEAVSTAVGLREIVDRLVEASK